MVSVVCPSIFAHEIENTLIDRFCAPAGECERNEHGSEDIWGDQRNTALWVRGVRLGGESRLATKKAMDEREGVSHGIAWHQRHGVGRDSAVRCDVVWYGMGWDVGHRIAIARNGHLHVRRARLWSWGWRAPHKKRAGWGRAGEWGWSATCRRTDAAREVCDLSSL